MKDGRHWGHIPMWEQLPGTSEVFLVCSYPSSPTSWFASRVPVDKYGALSLWAMLEALQAGPMTGLSSASWHLAQCQAHSRSSLRVLNWTSQAPRCHPAHLHTLQTQSFCSWMGHIHAQSPDPYLCPHSLCVRCPRHLLTSSFTYHLRCHFLWKPSPTLQVKSDPTVIDFQSILDFFFIAIISLLV